MVLPHSPVNLSVEEAAELTRKLARMRHDINNHVAVIVAAIELIRLKPHTVENHVEMIAARPVEITEAIQKFSAEFDKVMGIVRPETRQHH